MEPLLGESDPVTFNESNNKGIHIIGNGRLYFLLNTIYLYFSPILHTHGLERE